MTAVTGTPERNSNGKRELVPGGCWRGRAPWGDGGIMMQRLQPALLA